MVVTLELLTDVYSQPDKKGNQKLIKKNVTYKKTFDTNLIQVSHLVTKNGSLSKKYCLITSGSETFTANHKFEYIERLILPVKVKGFKNEI